MYRFSAIGNAAVHLPSDMLLGAVHVITYGNDAWRLKFVFIFEKFVEISGIQKMGSIPGIYTKGSHREKATAVRPGYHPTAGFAHVRFILCLQFLLGGPTGAESHLPGINVFFGKRPTTHTAMGRLPFLKFNREILWILMFGVLIAVREVLGVKTPDNDLNTTEL